MNAFRWIFLLVGLAVAAFARSQEPSPTTKPDAPWSAEEARRLTALSSERPDLYLELGEELLETADSPERIELTRQLLVRAIEYGRSRTEYRRDAASAALALASMSKRAGERRWLQAIAEALEPSSAYADASREQAREANREAARRASLFLTQLRSGEGIEARESLAAPGVRQVLQQHERELSASGRMSVQDLENESKKWPCTNCSGLGILVPGKGQKGPARICPVCGGQPGLKLSAPDLAAQLHLQRRLLGDNEDNWAAMIASGDAPPARDPEPAEVASAFLVDGRLSIWRDGQWISPLPKPTPEAP